MSRGAKKLRLTILAALLLLFLFMLAACLIWHAETISDRLEEQILTQMEERCAQLSVLAASTEETAEQKRADYYAAMASSEDIQGASYAYDTISCLISPQGEELCRSRNMLLFTFETRDDTAVLLPVAFAVENSADVAQLVEQFAGANYEYGNLPDMAIEGFWQDDLFILTLLEYEDLTYSDYQIPKQALPADAEIQRYTSITTDKSGIRGEFYHVTAIVKSYGAQNYEGTDVIAGWQRADKLLEAFPDETSVVSKVSIMETYTRGNLFRRRIYAAKKLVDDTKPFDGYALMAFVCGASYSPLGLAVGDMFGSGMFLLMLVPFLAIGAYLLTFLDRFRRAELRPFQDELNRQQQALSFAQDAERSRREMTSAIAHELKTPIAVLSSYAEALQENIDAEKQAHYLAVIRDETEKMDQMVMELLDLSRLEAGRYKLRREDFNLTELVREELTPLERRIQEKQLELVWQIGEETVNADRFRFGQVVKNYMTNAIRHTPEGGKIILRIGMNHETFSVENQGRHIPPENLKRVWETFWQGDSSRSGKGSGLGLAICRSIITLHGGSCKVENTGAGVRFTANLEEEAPILKLVSREQETVALQYPIAQAYTTVEQVLRRLQLLEGTDLLREIMAGNLRLGAEPVTGPRQRLLPGYTLHWREFAITIVLCQDEKLRALIFDKLRGGGIGDPLFVTPISSGPHT